MSIQNITLSAGPGTPSVGTILSVGNLGSPTTYKPLGNVGNLKWNLKAKTADVTNQGTPWVQSIPTLLDAGTFTCDMHFIPSSTGSDAGNGSGTLMGHGFTSGLGSIFTQREILPWRLVYPDGTTEYFTGYVSDFTQDINLEKDLIINLTVTVVGEPIFA